MNGSWRPGAWGHSLGQGVLEVQHPGGELLRRGDPVVLLSRIGGVEVRVAGRVLGQPGAGGTVSVENTESRRVVRGRVVGAGVVEVR